MPVRLLTQSVLRWPESDQVLQQVEAWAAAQRRQCPSLQAVGLFGSYGRGTAGVGSDLDLLMGPLEQLPLSCDALVLTPAEFEQLLASGLRKAEELRRDLRWIGPGLQDW